MHRFLMYVYVSSFIFIGQEAVLLRKEHKLVVKSGASKNDGRGRGHCAWVLYKIWRKETWAAARLSIRYKITNILKRFPSDPTPCQITVLSLVQTWTHKGINLYSIKVLIDRLAEHFSAFSSLDPSMWVGAPQLHSWFMEYINSVLEAPSGIATQYFVVVFKVSI